MEPFAIRCTTCKARLKVRDPHALGQILPCPKCGSMVLVERSAAAAEIEETPTAGRSGRPTGVPSALPAATPDWVGTEAFEQIDRLLDPTPRPEPSSSAHQGRWKQVPQNEVDADDAGEPVRQTQADSETDSEVVPPSSMADDIAPPDSALTDQKGSEPVAVGRRYALVTGGVLFGTILAVGVTAVVLWRPPNGSVEASSAPVEKPTESEPQSSVTAEENVQPEAAPEPVLGSGLDSPVNDQSPERSELLVVEPDPSESPPPDPIPAESVDPPPVATDEQVTQSDPPPPEPVPEANDPAAPPPQAAPAAHSELPEVHDDGLASFARWLSSASADPNKASAPPPPTAAVAPAGDEAPVLAQPSRPMPQPVDVEAALKGKVAAIEFKDVALVDVLRTLSDLSTIPITVDPKALGRRMLSPRKPVNVLRRDATIAELFQAVLEPLRLDYLVSEGHVLVTTQVASDGQLVTIKHDLTDLAEGRSETAGELARWLTQLVAYGTWQAQGGAGSYRVEDTVLVIEQADTVQYQILVFCEKLRGARGLPPRSRLPAAAIRLEPVTQRMAVLQRPMTLRIWQEQNLDQIAARIEREAGITVLVDWQALHLAGWSPADRTRFFCHQQPLQQAMHSLLDPMGLAFRVIDEATLEISSPEAVAAQNDVEFYRLPAQSQSPEAVQALSAQIVDRVGQPRFQPLGGGSVAYDLASQTLIISLPQPAQQQLRELLAPPPSGR